MGGFLQRVAPTVDDAGTGGASNQNTLDASAQEIFNSILANVTTEINAAIGTIYPIPLQMIGTVAVAQVLTLTTDGTDGIASIQMIQPGEYQVAPASPNAPAYLRNFNKLAAAERVSWNEPFTQQRQLGSGASFTVAFTNHGSVTPQSPIQVNGTPTITSAGTNYAVGDLLVLTGGQSFVPNKIINAATTLYCFDAMRRRLVPDERNPFKEDSDKVKKELIAIGNGKMSLDEYYRQDFGPVAAIVQESVLMGNSL